MAYPMPRSNPLLMQAVGAPQASDNPLLEWMSPEMLARLTPEQRAMLEEALAAHMSAQANQQTPYGVPRGQFGDNPEWAEKYRGY